MIPYKNVNSIEEVKQIYPSIYGDWVYKKKKVIEFIEEELEALRERQNRGKISLHMRLTAEAKGVYRYLWVIDHITDQLVKWGWDTTDIVILITRMKRAGYDPYSTTEDTAGQFIESLPGHGFKTIQTENGDEYLVYNPKGYGQPSDKKDATPK